MNILINQNFDLLIADGKVFSHVQIIHCNLVELGI